MTMLLQETFSETVDLYDEAEPKSWNTTVAWESQPATTTGEAVRLCRILAEMLNADSFSLLFCAVQGETRRLAPVFDSSFPGVALLSKALSARAAEGFARQLTETMTPLWWSEDDLPPFMDNAARRWTVEIESPAPGASGIAFPVSQERGRCGALVFAGRQMVLDENALCDVHARCFSIFGDVARQRMQDCAKAPPVSKREIECLRLTANGLTSDDIASALGLSVHTANQYLTNSTHKLNAVNRIHAVAKALRSGLID